MNNFLSPLSVVTIKVAWMLILAVLVPLGINAQSSGKRPVIIIPGVMGSELVNGNGKKVWFSVKRDKTDDLRLPFSSPVLTRDRDSLRATDIIRKVELPVLPDVEVYQSLIDALEAKGYKEASWNRPKASDVFYVFAYDWRRDNVETARLLMQRMEAVKRTLHSPDLKFDILAHSMGGLVARYAAMYGEADLPAEGRIPNPSWAGGVHINKLMMFGTPNEGAVSALQGLLDGVPIVANRKLPLIDDLRPEDVMTAPAAFQLLPHRNSARFMDENLKTIQVDVYDVETWIRYGWGPIGDPKFLGKLKDAARLAAKDNSIKPVKLSKNSSPEDLRVAQTTYSQLRAYLASVLSRAKRFHAALDAPEKKIPLEIYAYGGNCEPTQAGVILVKEEKKDRWQTILEPKDVKTADGRVIKKDEVRNAIMTLGDGRVTQRSLLTIDPPAQSQPAGTDGTLGAPLPSGLFTLTSSFFGCGTHTKLFLDKPIQDSFLSALIVSRTAQP